jgi:hypothetical protein
MGCVLLVTTVVTSGCVDEHPAYELEFDVDGAVLEQTSDDPSGRANAVVTMRVVPTAEHSQSWTTLGASERFPEGLLRLYEPSDNPRFRYNERLPVLAIPAELVGDRVAVSDRETELTLRGQVSNLELEPLCGQSVVFVPRLVVWETEPAGPGERDFDFERARNVRVPADAVVECR